LDILVTLSPRLAYLNIHSLIYNIQDKLYCIGIYVGFMYKCKYLKFTGKYFTSTVKNESSDEGVYECGIWRDKLGTSANRCNDCKYYSPSNIIMPEKTTHVEPISKQTNSSYCRIFHEPEKYNMALQSNQSLVKYHPWRDGTNKNYNEYSKLILSLKNQKPNPDAIDYFANQLSDIFNDNEEYVICVIPSSKKGLAPSGTRIIAKRLCNSPIIDGTDVIIRNRAVKPNHTKGPRRSLELELSSLTIAKKEVIKGK